METERKAEDMYILFCESPFEPGKVDPDYEEEYAAARRQGFQTLLYSYEDLSHENRYTVATRRIKPHEKETRVIYRGWMLRPEQYRVLYNDLLNKNLRLINDPVEYRNCHYLPDSLRFIEQKTPQTVYQPFDGEDSIDKLITKTTIFGSNPVVLKDYVKSEKHHWETACFLPDASDTDRLKQTILNLLRLRGSFLNEGIVVREFVEFRELTIHSKSGMPLTEEYRLFFLNKQLIGTYDYWEEGEYTSDKPDTSVFEELAQQVESNFFSMDIARRKDGTFVIVELGDGQVSGLPDKTDRDEFYRELKNR